MTITEIYTTTKHPEYNAYIKALCRLASSYVPEIRKQFAAKAVENFQNETLRALVLAYGEETEKLDAARLQDFTWAARDIETAGSLEDTCLNNAKHYAATIKFFYLGK